MRKLLATTAFTALMFVGASVLDGGEVLRMQVSPAVSRAPAWLTVRIHIDAPPDSRFLRVTAESSDFYRSSQIPVDGKNDTPLKVFEFANLPSGTYDVTGVLLGTFGTQATVSRIAQVVESVGNR